MLWTETGWTKLQLRVYMNRTKILMVLLCKISLALIVLLKIAYSLGILTFYFSFLFHSSVLNLWLIWDFATKLMLLFLFYLWAKIIKSNFIIGSDYQENKWQNTVIPSVYLFSFLSEKIFVRLKTAPYKQLPKNSVQKFLYPLNVFVLLLLPNLYCILYI